MIITEIEIINIGPHKHFKADNLGSVVGILGPNGSGKSNILHALEAALTGNWPDNNSSYVRNNTVTPVLDENGKVDTAITPANGSVRICFTHQGINYESFKQEGATKKNSLKIGNAAPITKTKEIREHLAAIFRADTKLLGSSVFIPQGYLDKILLGTPMEREDFYIRLLNLEYCIQRSKAVEARISLLISGITDLSTYIQEADDQRRASEEQVNALQAELFKTPDVAEDFNAAINWRMAFVTLKDVEDRLVKAEQQYELAVQDREDFLNRNSFFNTPGSAAPESKLSNQITESENGLAETEKLKAGSQDMLDKLTSRDRTAGVLNTAESNLIKVTEIRNKAYAGSTSECAGWLQQARSCVQSHKAISVAKTQYNAAQVNLGTLDTALKEAVKSRSELYSGSTDDCRRRRQLLLNGLEAYKVWSSYQEKLITAKAKLDEANQNYNKLDTAKYLRDESSLPGLIKCRASLEESIKQLTSATAICKDVYKHAGDCCLSVNVPCGLCGLTISALPADMTADIKEREANIIRLTNDLNDVVKNINIITDDIKTFKNREQVAKANIRAESNNIDHLTGYAPAKPDIDYNATAIELASCPDPDLLQRADNNIFKITQERTSIENSLGSYKSILEQRLALTEEESAKLETELTPLLPQLQQLDQQATDAKNTHDVARGAYSPYANLSFSWDDFKKRVSIEELNKIIEAGKRFIKSLKELSALLSQKNTTIEVHTKTLAETKQTAASANVAYNTQATRVCQTNFARDLWVNFNPMAETEFESKIATLQATQQARASLEGRTLQARKAMNDLIARVVDLKKSQEVNAKRQLLADELRSLKDLLSRDGLPLAYVRHCFRILVKETDKYLQMLNANFVVKPNEQESCSFIFRRTDQDTDGWLPMNKLSGGQKVRLGIAFLLAVQRSLVPDVGLLVLDEPSTHLDQEGIESLRFMLNNLSQLFAGSDFQLWIVDHCKDLESALSTKLYLTKNG